MKISSAYKTYKTHKIYCIKRNGRISERLLQNKVLVLNKQHAISPLLPLLIEIKIKHRLISSEEFTFKNESTTKMVSMDMSQTGCM